MESRVMESRADGSALEKVPESVFAAEERISVPGELGSEEWIRPEPDAQTKKTLYLERMCN